MPACFWHPEYEAALVRDHLGPAIEAAGMGTKIWLMDHNYVMWERAKWMLDDPAVNFAISTRGGEPGLDHFGFQVDEPGELAELKARAEAADMPVVDEGATTCCYARSDKHWVQDPQGTPWEHFHTLGDIPVFS